MRILHTKLLRDLRRQPQQLVAVGVLIVLGVALYGASYDAYKNLDASYNQYFVDQHFADLTVSGGDSQQIAAKLAAEPGVQAAQVRTQVDIPLQVPGRRHLPGPGDRAARRRAAGRRRGHRRQRHLPLAERPERRAGREAHGRQRAPRPR